MPVVQQHSTVAVRSSLALLGMFLYIVRGRFSDDLPDNVTLPWLWYEEPTSSGIIIELAYNPNMEKRGNLPGVYIGKTPTNWSPVVVGDMVGANRQEEVETKMMHGTTMIIANVVSRHLGEAFQIADVVSHTFIAASDVIRRFFNLRDVRNITEGAPTPYQKEDNLWQVPISVELEFTERWVQKFTGVPVAAIMTSLAGGNQPPDEFFTAIANGSLVNV